MYWKLDKAREELTRRQRDWGLIGAVDKYLGDCPIPCPIPAGTYGFLTRHIASARLEDLEFERRCQEAGLKPVFLEYLKDQFVSNNPSKTRLVRLFILDGYGKNGGPRIWRFDLLEDRNLGGINGIPLYLIKTKWGESLVQFHHRAREIVGLKERVVDISAWLKSIGRARQYYRYLLAACVVRGILFESFESPGFPDLDVFTQSIVLPAWKWVTSEFGHSPLIVRHPETCSPEDEQRILNWYPSGVLGAIPKEFVRGYL